GEALSIIRVCANALRSRSGCAASRPRRFRALLEHRDGRQALAFEELEERAAAGRDVGDVVRDPELLDRGQRVAAAGDRERAARGDRLADPARAGGEFGMLEHADRTVPYDRARV